MRRRPCRRSYRPAPENRSRSRSDCSSKNCCHASCVCPYRSPQKLSFISARKCWKCSVIGIIFAIGCRSPFRKGFSLLGKANLHPLAFTQSKLRHQVLGVFIFGGRAWLNQQRTSAAAAGSLLQSVLSITRDWLLLNDLSGMFRGGSGHETDAASIKNAP